MPYPINPAHRLLLEDGVSYLLLEDGTSKLILDESTALDDPLNAGTVTSLTPTLTFAGETIAAVGLPALRSGSGLAYSSRTNTTITAPTGIKNGDLLLLVFAVGNASPPTPTAPAGFTLLSPFPVTNTSAGFSVKTYVYYKVASGESGNYTVTHATSSSQAWMGAYSNINTSNPITVTPSTNTDIGVTTTATSITTTSDNSMVVFISQDWDDTNNNLSAPTGTTPTFNKEFGASATAGILFVADGVLATAGATGSESITNNSSSANPFLGSLIALNPAPANLNYEVQVDTVNTFDSTPSSGNGSPALLHSYSETNDDLDLTCNLANGFPSVGQSFTGDGHYLDSVKFWLKKNSLPTGNAVAKLYAVTGGAGSLIPTGAALATSNNFDVSTLTTTSALITFTFDETYKVINGTNYIIALDYQGNVVNNYLQVGADNSSPSDSGNGARFANSSGTWSALTQDVCFYVYTAPALATIPLLDKQSSIDTGFIDDTAGETTQPLLLLEDGTSFLLLEDGTSKLVINESYPSGDYVTYTVPSAVLSSSTTYYWRARNQPVNGSYGSWSETRNFITSGGVGADLTISKSDTATLTETVTILRDPLLITTSDTTTLSESVLRLAENYVTTSDTATTSELVTLLVTNFIATTDSTTLSETILKLTENRIAVSDNSTLTESTTQALTPLMINVSDTTTLTESIGALSTPNDSIQEVTTATENVAVSIQVTPTVSDSSSLSESVRSELNSFVPISDTATTSENSIVSIAGATPATINVQDSSTLSESLSLLAENRVNVSDTTTLSETISKVITPYFIAVTDTATASEAITSLSTPNDSIADTLTATESINVSVQMSVNKSDTATTTESVTPQETVSISVSDSSTVSDSVVVIVAQAGTFNIVTNDSVTLVEAAGAFILETETVSDLLLSAELVRLQITSFVSQTDTATTSESSSVAIASATNHLKVWNGSAFVAKPLKVWNGSAWTAKPLKYWNGSAWITRS